MTEDLFALFLRPDKGVVDSENIVGVHCLLDLLVPLEGHVRHHSVHEPLPDLAHPVVVADAPSALHHLVSGSVLDFFIQLHQLALVAFESPEIERQVSLVRSTPGVLGVRLMGGGFGGMLLAVVDGDEVLPEALCPIPSGPICSEQ